MNSTRGRWEQNRRLKIAVSCWGIGQGRGRDAARVAHPPLLKSVDCAFDEAFQRHAMQRREGLLSRSHPFLVRARGSVLLVGTKSQRLPHVIGQGSNCHG